MFKTSNFDVVWINQFQSHRKETDNGAIMYCTKEQSDTKFGVPHALHVNFSAFQEEKNQLRAKFSVNSSFGGI